jgi:hypothetical protein
MERGSFSIRFKPDKLREMISEGRTAQEIMDEFNISRFTLREHIAMLQDRDQKLYFVNGLFDRPEKPQKPAIKDGIVFSREFLDKVGFTPGDAFEVVTEDDRIILKKIDNGEE